MAVGDGSAASLQFKRTERVAANPRAGNIIYQLLNRSILGI